MREILSFIFIGLVFIGLVHAYNDNSSPEDQDSGRRYREKFSKMHAFKAAFAQRDAISPSPSSSKVSVIKSSIFYLVI